MIIKDLYLISFQRYYQMAKIVCVQEFSSKKTVSFKENKSGEYKLLCHANVISFLIKNMMIRAVLLYKVKPYENYKNKKV